MPQQTMGIFKEVRPGEVIGDKNGELHQIFFFGSLFFTSDILKQ